MTNKCNHSIEIYANTLDPTQIINATAKVDDDDRTIVTSNQTHDSSTVLKGRATRGTTITTTARQLFGAPNPQYLNAIAIAASQAIADTGAEEEQYCW